MLISYLKIALRNFLRNPLYSSINVSGLILGIACSILIFLWVKDELSFDHYNPENERTFKVISNYNYADQGIVSDHWTDGRLADILKSSLPEIELAGRSTDNKKILFKHKETAQFEHGNYADPDILKILNVTIVDGEPQNPLPGESSVAISKSMANRFFGDQPAIGKTLRINNEYDATVTAVFNDLPSNATERFDFIIPFAVYIRNETPDISQYLGQGWQRTFVTLHDKAEKNAVYSKMAEEFKKYKESSATPPPPPFLLAMHDWRLHSGFENGQQSGGRISYVISFTLVAILILIMACVNFMNLSTARSANRSREVGIRKVAGASQHTLIRQFLTESLLLSALSTACALLLVHLLLPLFNSFTHKQLEIGYSNISVLAVLISITLFTGFTAGSYPAIFLSSFKPASVLKGNLQAAFSAVGLRKALIVFQFGLSMIIIVCALVINNQISFMQNRNLGFNKNNVVSFRTNEDFFKNYAAFKAEAMQSSSIVSVAVGDALPMEIDGQTYYDWNGKDKNDDTYFNSAKIDYDYLQTLGFTLVQGRNFSPAFPADSANFIITEEAANRMGFGNPLGQRLEDNETRGEVIGVIRDFNNLSIQEELRPTALVLGKQRSDYDGQATVFVRYQPGELSNAIKHVTAVYQKVSPDVPISMRFVDEAFQQQFNTESMVSALSNCFTIIAILISCLGLFGLASFSTERRSKEIGVRKVLGASISGLTVLLCKDFTRLIIYAIIIGSPVAYLIMEEFLSKYPYHTTLNFGMFAIPAIVMLTISLSIVSYQAIKAALNNPVDALKCE